MQSDLPWWLVCRGTIHKFRCVPHLTGRRFEHGVTDCYTLFRDAYHLAGIEMPDFYREDDWWRNGQNLYLDNLEATGLYQVPLSAAQPGDVLLCCFGSSVPNHAAIYCGDGELLHHIPEQLSKRERYTDKWQRRTPSGVTGHGAHLPLRGFTTIWSPHRPSCENGAEAIRALATQLPAFRQKLSDGWYQVRIAGRDVSTSGLTAQLHETLPDGAVIHIVPRVAGAKSGGVFQIVTGLPPLPDHSLPPEPPLQHGGSHWGRWYDRHPVFSRCQYGARWCGADAGTESQNSPYTDNG
ncbi:hypothetical protein ECZU06_18090 [Escherichia coli]|nr:hypothetical protein ECZU06_18090 [Escherichia coli]